MYVCVYILYIIYIYIHICIDTTIFPVVDTQKNNMAETINCSLLPTENVHLREHPPHLIASFSTNQGFASSETTWLSPSNSKFLLQCLRIPISAYLNSSSSWVKCPSAAQILILPSEIPISLLNKNPATPPSPPEITRGRCPKALASALAAQSSRRNRSNRPPRRWSRTTSMMLKKRSWMVKSSN